MLCHLGNNYKKKMYALSTHEFLSDVFVSLLFRSLDTQPTAMNPREAEVCVVQGQE